jgi:hypothetical protein
MTSSHGYSDDAGGPSSDGRRTPRTRGAIRPGIRGGARESSSLRLASGAELGSEDS